MDYSRSKPEILAGLGVAGRKLQLDEAEELLQFRLAELGFQLSPSQPSTPPDGNCLMHALLDQLSYTRHSSQFAQDHRELRNKIVEGVDSALSEGYIIWPGDPEMGTVENWRERMVQPGVFGDEVFLTLAANMIRCRIVIIPAFRDNSPTTLCSVIQPSAEMEKPLFLFFFSESDFLLPHYQSVRPVHSDNVILDFLRGTTVCPHCNTIQQNIRKHYERNSECKKFVEKLKKSELKNDDSDSGIEILEGEEIRMMIGKADEGWEVVMTSTKTNQVPENPRKKSISAKPHLTPANFPPMVSIFKTELADTVKNEIISPVKSINKPHPPEKIQKKFIKKGFIKPLNKKDTTEQLLFPQSEFVYRRRDNNIMISSKTKTEEEERKYKFLVYNERKCISVIGKVGDRRFIILDESFGRNSFVKYKLQIFDILKN